MLRYKIINLRKCGKDERVGPDYIKGALSGFAKELKIKGLLGVLTLKYKSLIQNAD